nr:SPASM domain-containing protein [Paenibacillus antri]
MFPEFKVGDLLIQDVGELWHGEAFAKMRETLSCGLMPVCSKCILLYLNGR